MTTPRMRAGTTDRQAAVDRLTHHFTQGRLTPDEFDERVGQAYAATHLDELPGLLADLPEESTRRGRGPGGWQPYDGRPVATSTTGGSWSPQRRQMHRPPTIVAVLAAAGALAMLITVMALTHGLFPLLWIALIPLLIARGHRRRQWSGDPQELHRSRCR